jgi:hypothetical protein
MYLERDLVGIILGMLGELASTSKNPPSIGYDENVASHSTLTAC